MSFPMYLKSVSKRRCLFAIRIGCLCFQIRSQITCLIELIQYVCSNVFSNPLPERIGCICWVFLRCVFSNVSSKRFYNRMHNHIDCICFTFHHCVFSNESSNCLSDRLHNHIGCICWIFLHCVFSNAISNYLPERL